MFKESGLVLGAGNFDELRCHAREIIENRDRVVDQQKARYDEWFKAVEDPIGVIVDDIERELAEND